MRLYKGLSFALILGAAVSQAQDAEPWEKYMVGGSSQPSKQPAQRTFIKEEQPSYNKYLTVRENPAPVVERKVQPVVEQNNDVYPTPESNERAPIATGVVAPYTPPVRAVEKPYVAPVVVEPKLEVVKDVEEKRVVERAPIVEAPVLREEAQPSNDEYYANPDKLYSQHFDNDIRPVRYLRAGFSPKTEFTGYGETDIAMADFKVRLFRAEDFLLGTSIDAWLFADAMYFVDNPNIKALPDGLISAGGDIGAWWRFENGFSFELRGAPGIYSDVTTPTFSMPGTANFYYTVCPELSLQLGVTYRPKWDQEIMPNIGLVWQPHDFLRVQAALPSSRIDLFPRHILNFYGTFDWRNTTYWLDDETVDLPKNLTFNEYVMAAGVTLCLFDQFELSAEVGTYLKKELKADVTTDDTIELSKEKFLRCMIGHRF